jgi:hypothetical protein
MRRSPLAGSPDWYSNTKRGVTAVTQSQAEEYRRLARACRGLAETLSTEEGRAHLAAMAEVWERLADQQEQGSDLSEAPAPPPPASEQPVVQQQQQVQPKDEGKDD